MTRAEAIQILKNPRSILGSGNVYDEAVEIAIEALKAKPRDDAVSREAVIELIDNSSFKNDHEYKLCRDRAKALPSVQLERPKGEWKPHKLFYELRCSNCASRCPMNIEWNYCPNCGAKIEGESVHDTVFMQQEEVHTMPSDTQ